MKAKQVGCYKKIAIYLFLLLGLLFGLGAKAFLVSEIIFEDPCSYTPDKESCEFVRGCSWSTEKEKCCRELEVNWPPSPTGDTLSSCTSVTGMIKYIYDWAISLGGLAAFISLIMAGFQYLTSTGDTGKMREARDRIQSAFFGIVLLLSSWLILNTINPELTILRTPDLTKSIPLPSNFKLDAIEVPECSFVKLYVEKNWEGGIFTIEPGEIKRNASSISSYTIYREVTEEREKKQCREESGSCSTFNDEIGKYYKPGGACILELHGESPWWSIAACGDKIGSLGSSSVDNLETYKESAGGIKCIKLIKIKTGF